MSSPYVLTPADIILLRTSIRRAIPLDNSSIGQFAFPSIIYLPADDAFGLVYQSRMRAVSTDARVLAQCLRCERAEPGFIERILNAEVDCAIASLSPDLARAASARAYEERVRAREAAEARQRTAQRRETIAPGDITLTTLDDLL